MGSGAPLRHIQNRAAALQSWFRRTSTWGFFQADNTMKRSLFFKNRARVRGGLGKQTSTKFEKAFGSVVPSSIPESTAWWRRQSKELAAITDDVESGLMNLMVSACRSIRAASSQVVILPRGDYYPQQPQPGISCLRSPRAVCKAAPPRDDRVSLG